MSAAADPLAGLPRLDETAMGPCGMCGAQLLGTGFPIFYRLDAKRCGIDAKEVNRHVGLAMAMGGGQGGLVLASVMGPGVKPVVVIAKPVTFNVCTQCAQNNTLEMIFLVAAERLEEEPKG